MAIEDSATQALPVKDIYAWIVDHFPYFQGAPTGWKNSVRHNLSLNKCFKKVDKSPVSVLNSATKIRCLRICCFAECWQGLVMDGGPLLQTQLAAGPQESPLPSVPAA